MHAKSLLLLPAATLLVALAGCNPTRRSSGTIAPLVFTHPVAPAHNATTADIPPPPCLVLVVRTGSPRAPSVDTGDGATARTPTTVR